VLEVLRSRPASNRRSDGPPELKHRDRGERWTQPLWLGLKLKRSRRRGVQRPLEQLLGYHGGVGDVVAASRPPLGDIYGGWMPELYDVIMFVMCPPLFSTAPNNARRGGVDYGGEP